MSKAAAEQFKAKGNECFKKKDYRGAIGFYTQAIDKDPTNHTFFSNRSACYMALDDYENAAEDGRLCIQANKHFIKGYFRLATALEKMSMFDKVTETLKMGLAIEPQNKDLLAMENRVKNILREEKSAKLQAQAAQYEQAGEWDKCFKTLESARKIDAGNQVLQDKFAQVKVKYERAEKQRVANLDRTEGLKEQGDAKYKEGMFEEAITFYSQCITAAAKKQKYHELHMKALSNRAACYKQLSNFDETIADCTTVLEHEPNNVKALIRRAQAFEAVERYKLALADVKTVLYMPAGSQGQTNFKTCMQMQGRLQMVIEKLKSGNY